MDLVSLLTNDGVFRVANINQGKEIISIKIHNKPGVCLSNSPCIPQLFLSSSEGQDLKLIDIQK